MVDQIQLPPVQAFSGGADFSQLANLGNVYQAAQEKARQQAALAALGNDPVANAQALTKSGSLPLATLGIQTQMQQRTHDEQVREFQAQMALRQAAEQRAQTTFEEDSPEGRAKKLTAAGVNPQDPAYGIYIATGQNAPDAIKQAAEKRAQLTFEQEQKTATPEGRRQVALENGLDVKDTAIRNWIIGGGDLTKARAGLGAPIYGRDPATGQLTAYQLSNTGDPVPVTLPGGQQILGPGEVAQQRAQGSAVGKGIGGAQVALPDVIRVTDNLVDTIDKINNHEGKDVALGRGSHLPDWMVAGTRIADFRALVAQLGGQAMQQNMSSLRGAGLGSVSDFEQRNLMNAFVAASTAQTQEGFDKAMATAKRSAEKIRDIAKEKAAGNFTGQSSVPTSGPQGTTTAKPDPLGLR